MKMNMPEYFEYTEENLKKLSEAECLKHIKKIIVDLSFTYPFFCDVKLSTRDNLALVNVEMNISNALKIINHLNYRKKND